MDPCDRLCYPVSIPLYGFFEKEVGFTDQAVQLPVLPLAENLMKLKPHLFIWNPDYSCSLLFLAVCQVSKMDQERQYVILPLKRLEFIFKAVYVNLDLFSADQLRNLPLKPFLIHINIGQKRFRRRSFFPIGFKFSALQGAHNGIGIVYGMNLVEAVSVVPAFCLVKAHMISLA